MGSLLKMAQVEEKNFADQVEEDLTKNLAEGSRKGFIRKVYCILSSQLVMTAGAVVTSLYYQPYRQLLAQSTGLFILMFVVGLVCMYALGCYRQVARTVPVNYLL